MRQLDEPKETFYDAARATLVFSFWVSFWSDKILAREFIVKIISKKVIRVKILSAQKWIRKMLVKKFFNEKMPQSGLGSMQGSSSTKIHLPPKLVFHQISSPTEGRLPPTITP